MNPYMILSLVAVIFCFWLAITAMQARDRRKETMLFAGVSASIGMWTSFPFFMTVISDPDWRLWGARVIYSFAAFVPFFFWYLYFVVMELREYLDKWVLRIAFGSSIFFSLFAWSTHYIQGVVASGWLRAVQPGPLFGFFVLYFGLTGGYGSYRMLAQFQRTTGWRRNRYKYLFLGFGIAYCGGLLHFAAAYTGYEPIPHDLLVISFVAILAYAILKHHLLEIELVVRDWMAYVLSGGATACVFFALCYPWLHRTPTVAAAVMALATGLLTPVSFPWVKGILLPAIDSVLFSNRYSYLQQLGQLPNDLLEFSNLRELLKFLATRLTEAAMLERVRIFMYDPRQQGYTETLMHEAEQTSENPSRAEDAVQLGEKSPLIEFLRLHSQLWIRDDLEGIRDAARANQELISFGGAACFPVKKDDDVLGVAILGPKRSGRPFNQEDLRILKTLRVRLENFLAQAMVITQEALNMVKDSHDMKNDVNALKGRVTWRAMRIAGWKLEFEKQIPVIEQALWARSPEARAAFEALKKQALEWFQEADRSRTIEDQAIQRLAHRLKNWAEYGRVVSEGFRGSRNMEAINVGEAAQMSVERWKPHAEKKNLQLAFETIPNLIVWGERSLIEQVIENLIDNAIKATRQGRVDVLCRSDREGVLIEVRDSGCGIPAEDLPTIFDKPFYQGRGRETLEQSTGVGLYLVSQYVRSLGGRVRAESQVDKGSSFFVHLPRYDQRKGAAA